VVPSGEDDAEFSALGKHLASARARLGLTQGELARLTGIDRTALNRIERSQRRPTLAQVSRLATALQVSLQWFITGSNWPGTALQDIAIELQYLGTADLWVPHARLPGAFRAREEVIALAVSGDEPEPRIIEAIPAILAWNHWNVRLLRAYASLHGRRGLYRLAWLADVAVTIDQHFGFPGGCPAKRQLSPLLRRLRAVYKRDGRKTLAGLDGVGRPAKGGAPHPVWKRWNINYAADLTTFRNRAAALQTQLARHPSGNPAHE